MSVTLELVQNGKVLKSYQHEGKHFVEAPPEGTYAIRLRNNSFGQKLCVLSVDGRNVVDGESAKFSGPGYVIAPYQTITIPGWRRTNNEVASFEFKPQEKSYASQIGDGTSNTGVIGLAVFDEKEKPAPVHIHHHHFPPPIVQPLPWYPQPHQFYYGSVVRSGTMSGGFDLEREGGYNEIHEGPIVAMPACAAAAAAPCDSDDTFSTTVENSAPTLQDRLRSHMASKGVEPETKSSGGLDKSRRTKSAEARSSKQTLGGSAPSAAASPTRSVEDLGTGYGARATMHTTETTFERASKDPSSVIQVQYAMRERLIEWGVPVTKPSPSPSAFPAQPSPRIAVRAPDGWTG